MLLHLFNLSYQVNQIDIIKNANLTINRPGIVLITGPSESGKSSLLYLIGGLYEPTQGEVLIEGKSLQNKTHSRKYLYQKDISFIFQGYHLIESLSVFENLYLLGFDFKKIKEALKKVEMEDFIDHKVDELSGGQKQRIAIVRAYLMKPKILLADEPSAALDDKTTLLIRDLLIELSKECLILIVTHDKVLMEIKSVAKIHIEDGNLKVTYQNMYSQPLMQTYQQFEVKIRHMFKYILLNIRLKKGRLLLSMLSQFLSISFMLIIFSFSSGMKKYLNDFKINQTDLYRLSVMKNDVPLTAFTQEEIDEINQIKGIKKTYMQKTPLLNVNQYENVQFIQLPYDLKFNIQGHFPASYQEVLINQALKKQLNVEIGDQITTSTHLQLLVTGIIQEIGEELRVYFCEDLLKQIDYQENNYQLYVECEPHDMQNIFTVLNSKFKYHAYSETNDFVMNMEDLKNMIEGALAVFLAISLITNIIMNYLLYYAFLLQKRKEILTLVLYGYEHLKIYLIYIYESLFLSLISVLFGILMGFFSIQVVNHLTGLIIGKSFSHFFVIPIDETLMTGIEIVGFPYLLITLVIVTTTLIAILLSVHKIFKTNFIHIIREEELC